MSADRFLGTGALLLSVLLHIALGLALILGFATGPAPKPAPAVNSLPAVSIDKAQVERELRRIRQREDADKAAEARRKQELAQLIRQRKTEQARLRQIKQERETEAREAEAARIRRQAAEELEKKRRLEQEQKAAAARKKQAAERRAAEKRAAERREAERRRQEQQRWQREQQLQAELEAEQRARQDQAELAQYTGLIIEAVAGRFNRLGLPGGLSCVVRIRMLASGQVAEVAIVRSSGNALFDSRAETAVRAASPLPVPANARLFEKMRNIRFTFAP